MNVKGLVKRSSSRRESDIVYLSKKPIRELWEKAASIKSRQNHVFDLFVKATKGHNYKELERLEQESAELAEQENDIKEAMRRK